MSIHLDPSTWRLRTQRNQVPVKVLERTGEYDGNLIRVSETYIIQASKLSLFLDDCFPAPILINGFPYYYPRLYANGLPTCTAQSVSFEALVGGRPIDPFQSDTDAADGTYEEFLKIRVDYGTAPCGESQPEQTDPKTFLEVSASVGGNFLHNDLGESAKWSNPEGGVVDVKDKDTQRIVTELFTEWSIKWNTIPWSWFQDTFKNRLDLAMGKVNSTAMTMFHKSPAECILFLGYDYAQSFSYKPGYIGQPFITVNMKFSEKNFTYRGTRVNHNMFYHPTANRYYYLLPDGVNKTYEAVNLNALFSP